MARYHIILVPLISVLVAVSGIHCWQLLKTRHLKPNGLSL